MRTLFRLALLMTILGSLATMPAQTTAGTFGGTVSDATGGRVVQATVTALNVETGQAYKAVTTGTGDFVIVQVPPGNYEVRVVANGFKTLSRKGLILEVAGKVTLELGLEVGSISESVSVTGEAPMLRTQDAQIGDIIDGKAIENLPQLDRNPMDLLRMSGNVSGDASASSPAGSPGSNIRINGGRMQGLDVLVDGQSVMSGKYHALYAAGTPSMEQVDEFKVITNGIPAEYGRVSGGLVSVATKGGTNGLHGQGFEYFRNQLFNAQTWEQNWQAQTPATFHQNDFGGAIGGPVVLPKIYDGRNKTFFFFNYEGLRVSKGGTSHLGMAASAEDRVGNLSGLLSGGAAPMMYDPLGETDNNGPNGYQRKLTLFPNNGTVIPASRIDPLAKIMNDYQPLPNHASTPGSTQQNAALWFQNNKTADDRWSIRLDHNLTDNQRLAVRFNRDNYSSRLTDVGYSVLTQGNQQIRPQALNGSVAWTWTMNPTTIMEMRGSVMHNPLRSKYAFPNDEAKWPIDPLITSLTQGYPGAIDYRVWSSNANGWGDPIGNQDNGGQDVQSLDAQTSYDFVAAVTKIWGKHTFKTGFDARRLYDNHWELLYSDLMYQGWAVDQSNDNRWDDRLWSSTGGMANTWGSWLLGVPDSGGQSSVLTLTNAQNYYAAYIQDDFKVSKRLTLNLGLRWDMETPISDRYNNSYAFNPKAPSAYSVSGYNWTGALQSAGLTAAQIASVPTPSWVSKGALPDGAPCFVGTSCLPGRLGIKYHPWQFAPRLAGAYQLNDKTVVRASWGMMYLTATGDYWNDWLSDTAAAAMPGAPDRTNGLTGTMIHNNQSLFLPSQYTTFDKTNSALNRNIGTSTFYEQFGTNINEHAPLEQNWNISIQRELGWNTMLEIGYNGNHSGDLLVNMPNTHFPVSLINKQNTTLLQTQVANPLANQTANTNGGITTGPTVPLGLLMLSNPAFGGLTVYGQNLGRANYNGVTLKVQKRFSQGLTFLFTYTYSKSLDDFGSVAGGGGAGVTAGSKGYQSFQTLDDLYGYSPSDMTHRATFYHDYQMPFGKGRKLLGTPKGVGGKILDGIVGGWEYSGIWIFHTGVPLTFGNQSTNVSQSAGILSLWGSMSTNKVTPANFTNPNALLTSGQVNTGTAWGNPGGTIDLGDAKVRRFNAADFFLPQAMTPGNIPNIFPWIRQPYANSYDASLMKNFGLARDGKIYLQFRVEAQNVLNIRGLGNYNTTVGDSNFGLITSSAQNPRNMQISARIFF